MKKSKFYIAIRRWFHIPVNKVIGTKKFPNSKKARQIAKREIKESL